MSLHRHCDRCEAHMKITVERAKLGSGEPQIVRGTRQGLMGPIPNVLDICASCQAALLEWLGGAS